METLIVHDLRRWHVANWGIDRRLRWNESQLASALRNLRTQLAASTTRDWCFAWELDHPNRWHLVRVREPSAPSRRTPGRGKVRNLDLCDLWDLSGRAALNAWDLWLGRPDSLATPVWEPSRQSTIEPQIDPGVGPPPSGSILGHPGASAVSQLDIEHVAMRDAILLRYLTLKEVPYPKDWQAFLPPVIPDSKFFEVWDWRKMAYLLRSTK